MGHVRMRVRMLRGVTVTLVVRGQWTRTSLRVAPVLGGPTETQMALLQMGVVPLGPQGVRVRVCMWRPVYHLSYFGILVADVVGELGLLKTGGRHPLVRSGRTSRRIRGVEARLDEGLARLTSYHGLELASGERVHVSRL